MKTYQPIDCNFYDVLEALATQRKVSEIVFLNENDAAERINTRILDFYIENKAEYMKLEQGSPIRLDRIISVDGKILEGSCKL